MASTNDFASGLQALANPHDEFASGLQALADWDYAAPPSPAAGLPSDSLPASPSSSYGYYYGQHDPISCIHARDLCNQRYVDLQASMAESMAELEERWQSRRGRSTWGRTKSFLGNLTKRALSLRERKKPDGDPESESEPESELGQAQSQPPIEDHSDLPVRELSAETDPVELQPSYAVVSELAAHCLSAYSPMNSSVSVASAPRMSIRSMSSGSSTHHSGYRQPAYNPHVLMSPPFTPTPRRPRPRAPRLYVPPGQMPHASMPVQVWPLSPPTPSSTGMSSLSVSTMSTSGSHRFVSPRSSMASKVSTMSTSGSHRFVSSQNSMLSNPSSILTDATGVTDPDAPFCDSPVQLDELDAAPWDQQATTAHDAQWPAPAMVAELPGSGLDAAQWFPQPSVQHFAQPDVMVPFMESAIPSAPHHYVNMQSMGAMGPMGSMQPMQSMQSMQSMQPVELPTAANFQYAPSQWQTAQVLDGAKPPPVVPDTQWQFNNQHATALPQHHKSQPVLTPRRQHSYNSTISNILDFSIPDDTVMSEPAPQPPSPPMFQFVFPAAQPRTAGKRSAKRRKSLLEATSCVACNYTPKGQGIRRKMQKHNNTDGHRRKTGQAEASRVNCWECDSTFNRDDNLWSHLKKNHGYVLPEEYSGRESGWKEWGSALKLEYSGRESGWKEWGSALKLM